MVFMTKDEFKKTTVKCFLEYGFLKYGKNIIRELKDIFIEIKLFKSNYGDYYYIHTYVWFKEIHPDISLNPLPQDYDMQMPIRFCINEKKAFEIHYLELSIDEYINMLKPQIEKHLNPIINDEIKYLKSFNKYYFSEKVREILGL
jgi:hypothetical protein